MTPESAFQLVDIDGVTNQKTIQVFVRITAGSKARGGCRSGRNWQGHYTDLPHCRSGVKVQDDHGISKSWIEFSIDGAPRAGQQEFSLPENGQLDDLEESYLRIGRWSNCIQGQILSLQITCSGQLFLGSRIRK